MRKESLRRHGVLDQVQGTRSYELYRDSRPEEKSELEHMGANKSGKVGQSQLPREEQAAPRTAVELGLEDYKKPGAAWDKFKKSEKPTDQGSTATASKVSG